MKKITLAMMLCLVPFGAGFAQNVVVRIDGGSISASSVSNARQKEIGKGVMEFMYDYRYLRDTTDVASEVTDRMILQVGYGISKFSSYRTMQVDSLIRLSTADQIQANPSRYIGGQTWSVYKNYPTGKFTTTDKISTDWFLVEEPVPVQEWTMTGETKEILGYRCKSAKCSFRGRDYTAYYTDEIPVADGPWKFSGLPGFILEVTDADRHYSFTCVGINSKADRAITMPEVQYNKTSRVKYYQTRYKFDTNPIGYLETVSGIKVNVQGNNGETMSGLDKPRELTHDYMETDWKNN